MDKPIYKGRREFLKSLALGSAALAFPVGALLAECPPNVQPAEDDTILAPYKGQTLQDAGYFYCPYVPLMTCDNSLILPAAIKTRYGLSII